MTGAFVVILSAMGFGRSGYPAVLPYMKQGLSLTNTQMGLLATGNLSGYLLSSVAVGFLAIRYKPRNLIILCQLVVAATLALTGLSSSFAFALVMQTVVGAASAGCVVTTLGVVSSSFSRTTRGLATGVVIGGAGLGLILSSGMVSVIQASYRLAGWRYSWFALGLGVLLATILSYALFRADERERAATAARGGDRPALAWSRVYKIALVWYIAVASAFFAFAFAGYSTFFVQFVIGEAGLSKKTAERLWGLVGISSLFSGIVWGWLSDVWGRKPSLIIALLTLTVSIALSAARHSIPALGLSAMLFGLTMYSTLAIIVAIYGDQIQPGLTQATIGLTSLVFGMGQVMGAVVPGRLADLTGSFIPAFALATGAALVGMFMSLLLPLPTGPEGWLAVDWD